MNVTWLGIVVLAILILCVWRGYSRGFIKEIVSFFFVFLSLSLAWAINPYINEYYLQSSNHQPSYQAYYRAEQHLLYADYFL